jgi:hypothetical protein
MIVVGGTNCSGEGFNTQVPSVKDSCSLKAYSCFSVGCFRVSSRVL